ncbi:hypothetical protein NRF20_43000 [Streptomyces sp. R-74717]|uniref:hypothetical protein n=1 Tax=Streptomyces sp. R-74717 TaxID=2969820 RepID=UPI0039B61133
MGELQTQGTDVGAGVGEVGEHPFLPTAQFPVLLTEPGCSGLDGFQRLVTLLTQGWQTAGFMVKPGADLIEHQLSFLELLFPPHVTP